MDTETAYPLLGEDLFENSTEVINLYTCLSTTPHPVHTNTVYSFLTPGE